MKADSTRRHLRNVRGDLAGMLLFAVLLVAGPAFGEGSIDAARSFARWGVIDIADEVVLLFGSLLSLLCLYHLIALGIHTMSGGRYKRSEDKRGRRAKRQVRQAHQDSHRSS